jgi:hypothetical protein
MNMRPALASRDLAHGRPVDAVLRGDGRVLLAGQQPRLDDRDLRLVQAGVPVPGADLHLPGEGRPATPASVHISHILPLRANPQVLGVHAGSVVAGVEHREARWDGPNPTFVGEAVCSDLPLAVPEQPVPVAVSGASPSPATITANDVAVEPLLWVHH